MGGMLEAGVVGLQKLTYEEFYTLFTQVEVTLSSGPVSFLNSDTNDFKALSTGHFLLLEQPSTIVEPHLTVMKSFEIMWDVLQKLRRALWKQWTLNYLNTSTARQMGQSHHYGIFSFISLFLFFQVF